MCFINISDFQERAKQGGVVFAIAHALSATALAREIRATGWNGRIAPPTVCRGIHSQKGGLLLFAFPPKFVVAPLSDRDGHCCWLVCGCARR